MLKTRRFDVVVIGAGIAGVRATETLAASGVKICLVSSEDRLPYKRTKISKHIADGFDHDQFALQPLDWYSDNGVQLELGATVGEIDLRERVCRTNGGNELFWDSLLLATGGTPTQVPGSANAPKVHVMHAASDAERLRSALGSASQVLVAGAGVLGVEVAAQLAVAGCRVTLAAAGASVMPKELDDTSSQVLRNCLQKAGVEVLFGQRVERIDGSQGRSVRALLGGTFREFDEVVLCVGITPNIELPRRTGLAVSKGIIVNQHLKSSVPGVFAAGDVAEHVDGQVTNLWHAAEEQGRFAAECMLAGNSRVGPKNDFVPGLFRLKCEVFGKYFFSMGTQLQAEDPHTIFERNNDQYRALVFSCSRLTGVNMIDDGERAKMYELAVREGWSHEQVQKRIPF